LGAAAVSIPILIHLMSRFRRKPEVWGAMRFLVEAYRKQRRRLQVEKLLLLLVRCLLVLVLGLALAGPMLGGCQRNGLVFSSSSGRVVYLVIDDALSSQTREAGTTRLEQMKLEALSVVDEMRATDRAVIVRMGRPVEPVLGLPTSDRAALREAIESIQPRYSRGELLDALTLVQQSIDSQGVRDGDAVVVLLSDFPGSAGYFDQPLPPEIKGLGERATIVTARPSEGTENLQVMSLLPRRRMVVAEATGVTAVGGRVELRRFGSIAQPRSVDLKVWVESADGTELASSSRRVQWPAGQPEQGVNFDLPVQLTATQLAGAGRELVIRARLVAENEQAGLDVLPADDHAVAVVRLRSRLQVALVDDEQDLNPNAFELQPWQYVRAALEPLGPGVEGSFELSPMLPAVVNLDALEPFDAAVVLRPDELTPQGWQALRTFTDRGGLVWVFVPALEVEPAWAQRMARWFELPWAFGDALVSYESSEGSAITAAKLDQTTAPPELLQYLAADWREKLGWVSVYTWLPVSTEQEELWIALDSSDSGLPQRDKPALMAYRPVGAGALVFTATPLDTRFTNLPLRQLYVPLMHDTLRGVLGHTAGDASLTAGDRPQLGRLWRGVGELTLDQGTSTEQDEQNEDAATLLVQSDGEEVTLRSAVQEPGVYRGTLAGSPRLLAVNADSDAGDTFGGEGRLAVLLDSLGEWSYIQDKEQAGGVLSEVGRDNDLTWLLLWVLLALVLLETALARWFSHATDEDRPTMLGRAFGLLHGGTTTTDRGTGGGA